MVQENQDPTQRRHLKQPLRIGSHGWERRNHLSNETGYSCYIDDTAIQNDVDLRIFSPTYRNRFMFYQLLNDSRRHMLQHLTGGMMRAHRITLQEAWRSLRRMNPLESSRRVCSGLPSMGS